MSPGAGGTGARNIPVIYGTHHRLSWSYLDDLPQWRHLKKQRPGIEGQLTLP